MILIDTHVLVWMVDGAPVSAAARASVSRAGAEGTLFVSAVSAWELGILAAKGRLTFSSPVERWWPAATAAAGVKVEPLDDRTALESTRLPDPFHSDPADRFIVATARLRDMTVLTADKAILAYAKAGHVKALRAR